MTTLSSMLGNPRSPYRMPASDRPDPSDSNEGPVVVTPDGRDLPLRSAVLRGEAGGGLARVVLEQTFENPFDEALAVTYKMPLPADGAVSGYEFSIGSRVVRGKVEPKEAARELFEEAIADGKTAGLVEQERADIFTQSLGNIPPRATIVARITVDQRLRWLAEGEWELRFPTVIGPRYIGSADTDEDARRTSVTVAKDPTEIRARLHVEIDVRDELTRGGQVSSPSHRIVHQRSGMGATGPVILESLEGARLDRDIVVRWPVVAPSIGVSVAVARPHAELNGRVSPHAHLAYGLVTVVPPEPTSSLEPVARDLIVLLDTSGSMSGGPLSQAKRVIGLILDSLGPQDRFELVEFASAPNAWKREPVFATASNKSAGLRWIQKREAGGATEMHTAIMRSLSTLRGDGQRQVVLVTDGYIGGEQQIVDLCHERLPVGCRLHVVGVGSAINRSLAMSLARAGRGAEILVGLDEDAERASKRLLDRTAAPILTDVVIEGSAVVDVAPEHVPDVFEGAPLVCALSLSPDGGDLIVRGRLASGAAWQREMKVTSTRVGDGDQAIVALFAREHVADLEMRWTIGRETQIIDRTIEKVGVVFQIATRKTSWVAVDSVRSVDPTKGARSVEQPQELPYGTSLQSFGLTGPVAAAAPLSSAVMPATLMRTGRPAAPLGGPPPPAMMMGVGARAEADEAARTSARSTAAPEPKPAAFSQWEGRAKRDVRSSFVAPPEVAPAPLTKKRRSSLAVLLLLLLLALVLYAIVRHLFG